MASVWTWRTCVLDRDQTVSSRAWSLNLAIALFYRTAAARQLATSLTGGCVSGRVGGQLLEIPLQFGRDSCSRYASADWRLRMAPCPAAPVTVKGYVLRRCTKSWLQECAASRQPNPVKQVGCSILKRAIVITRCEKSLPAIVPAVRLPPGR